MSRSRANLELLDQFLDQRPIPLHFELNLAGIKILNPPAKAEPGRMPIDIVAEANSLHEPLNDDMHADLHSAGSKYEFWPSKSKRTLLRILGNAT
jgi:hypothetical protein